jgi:hypothetical protein
MLKQATKAFVLAVAATLCLGTANALEYVKPTPMSSRIHTSVRDCGSMSAVPTPLIAWGGDEATILTNGNSKETMADIFADKDL